PASRPMSFKPAPSVGTTASLPDETVARTAPARPHPDGAVEGRPVRFRSSAVVGGLALVYAPFLCLFWISSAATILSKASPGAGVLDILGRALVPVMLVVTGVVLCRPREESRLWGTITGTITLLTALILGAMVALVEYHRWSDAASPPDMSNGVV